MNLANNLPYYGKLINEIFCMQKATHISASDFVISQYKLMDQLKI